MIFERTGEIAENFHMLGHPSSPVYLLDSRDHPVIFDAGFSIMGPRYVEDIRSILGEREPSFLVLTHSHFDHCGAAGFLKRAFPRMSVLASPIAGAVLEKPRAIELIGKLSNEAVALANGLGVDDAKPIDFLPFSIDKTLSDGEVLPLGGNLTLRVIETPGHTRDSLSFHIPDIGVLLSGEALGIPDASGYIITECLSNYDQYAASMHRLKALSPEILCLGHYKAFSGTDVARYIDSSLVHCNQFKELVSTFLSQEKGDLQRVMERFQKLEYDGKREDAHPEAAYHINLKARIKAVLARKQENRK
jgi:glyoxylase-like metal-dependent hydrolase (beta-lactamase superfamily II)